MNALEYARHSAAIIAFPDPGRVRTGSGNAVTKIPTVSVIVERDVSWWDRAACRGIGPELFFPERGANADTEQARQICRSCPVRLECLEDALDRNERIGIWGGTNDQERRVIRRTRKAQR